MAASAVVLHVFDSAFNLVNCYREIVSVVTAEVGPGPFAIVVPPVTQPFSRSITRDTSVQYDGSVLSIGPLTIDTAGTPCWPSRPEWWRLRRQPAKVIACRALIERAMTSRPVAEDTLALNSRQRLAAAAETLRQGLEGGDLEACVSAAHELAGLGSGLTPAGDDFLVGAIFALWSTRPSTEAERMAVAMAGAAASRTTSLSAAWLEAAARGEASEAWHNLVSAIADDDEAAVARAIESILAVGHTSGADALAGFAHVLEGVEAV